MYAPNLLTCCAPTATMLMLLLALSGTAAGQQCGPAPLFDAFGTPDCDQLSGYQANFCGCIGSSMSSIPDCIDDAQPTCSTLKSCAYNYVESVTDLGSRSVTLDSSCANATLAMFHAALALYILPNPVNTPLQQQCYNTVCGMGSDSCKVNTTACSTSALYYPHGYWNLAVLVYVTVKNIRVNRTAVTYDTLLSLFSALEQDVAAAWSLPPQQAFMVRALDVALPSTTALSTVTLEFGLDFETPGGRGLYYRVRHLPTIYLPLTTAVLNTLPVGAGSSRNAFTTATWPITASYGEFDDPTSTVPLPATPELQCFTDYDIDYRIARSVFSSMPECVILGLVLPALSVLFVVVFMTIVKCGSTADELVKAHRARVACETCRVMNVAAYVLVTIRGMSTGVTDSLGICYDTNDDDSLSSSCVNWQMSFSTLAVVSPIIVVVVVLPVLLGATCHARVVAPQLHASCGRRVLRWVLVGLGPIVTMVISPGYIAIQSRLVAKGNCVVSPVVLQEAPLSLGFVILWCLCLVMAGFVMVIDGGSLCSQTACGRGAVNAMFILLAGHALLTGIFGLAVSGAWMGFLQRTGWAVYATTVIPSIVVSLVNDILFLVLFRRPMWRIEPVVDNQVAPGSAFQPATATAVPPPVATSAAVPSAVPVVDVAVALPPPPPPPPMLPTPYDTAAPSEDVEMAAR